MSEKSVAEKLQFKAGRKVLISIDHDWSALRLKAV